MKNDCIQINKEEIESRQISVPEYMVPRRNWSIYRHQYKNWKSNKEYPRKEGPGFELTSETGLVLCPYVNWEARSWHTNRGNELRRRKCLFIVACWRYPGKTKITNEEVLWLMSKKQELLNIINVCKLQYCRRVHRNERYMVFQNMLWREIKGKRSGGWRKLSWEADLKGWFKCSLTIGAKIMKTRWL